jgi:type II secretion system protein L
MSSVLTILFGGENPEAPLNWARVSRDTGKLLQGGELRAGDSAPSATAADTMLVLPGSEAQIKSLQLPASSDVQARAAAAYLFEGALAIDKEHTVYAVGAGAGRRLVAAVDRRRLHRWIERCNDAGVNPSAIHLDCAIWPVSPGVVQVVDLGGHAVVAGGSLGSFAIESDLAPALLPSWLAQAPGEVSAIQVSGMDATALASRLPQPAPTVEPIVPVDALAVLSRAACAPPAYAPDLRQGEFAIAGRKGAKAGAWSLAIGLGIAAAFLQLGVMATDGMRDAQAASDISAANEKTFMQLRPATKRITNLRAQVTAALNAARRPTANPAISSSALAADIVKAHPEIRLDEVRRDTPGQLVTLRFSAAQPAALDAAMADLGKMTSSLRIGQMQTAEGRVNLTVSMEAS